MEDDLILLQRGGIGQGFVTNRRTGRRLNAFEEVALEDTNFKFRRQNPFSLTGQGISLTGNSFRPFITDANISKKVTLQAVSENDYNRLANLDLFRGGNLEDVTKTKLTKSSFQSTRDGVVVRTSGQALSSLKEADLELLAGVVSERQGQILGTNLSPGLSSQGFSLLSGNFGR